ncbi:DUF4328 domain-containing protein [Nonomuraea maritima]|uniref:DUF4328 domain-containing protein n=1 Tax=Nonomuraea maritima TaxID=683260 RepID=UPI00371DD494
MCARPRRGAHPPQGQRGRTPRSSKALPNAWWAIWISVTLATQVVSRLLLRADDLESMAAAARFDVVSIAFMIIAALLATGVISRITHAQEERRSAAAAGLPPLGHSASRRSWPDALRRDPWLHAFRRHDSRHLRRETPWRHAARRLPELLTTTSPRPAPLRCRSRGRPGRPLGSVTRGKQEPRS